MAKINLKNCYFAPKEPLYNWHGYGYGGFRLWSGDWYDKDTKRSKEDWDIRISYRSTTSLFEEQFNKFADLWRNETAGYSTTLHITMSDSYLDIIGMGKEVVPFILKDLKKEPYHWFVALKAIFMKLVTKIIFYSMKWDLKTMTFNNLRWT